MLRVLIEAEIPERREQLRKARRKRRPCKGCGEEREPEKHQRSADPCGTRLKYAPWQNRGDCPHNAECRGDGKRACEHDANGMQRRKSDVFAESGFRGSTH